MINKSNKALFQNCKCKMDTPLISIITPCYNSEKFISETIESVINQTVYDWEMLITDDGSNDNSVSIIKNIIKKDNRIKLFQIKNSGAAIARNNSIKNAKGHYLAFLDSDDLWLPTFLEKSLIEIKKSAGFVFSSFKRSDEDGNTDVYKDFIAPRTATYHSTLKTNSIGCLTAFIDVKKLGKEYMPEVLCRQDMGLWLKYLKKIKYASGIQEPLAIYRIRAHSLSSNKKKLIRHQWFFYRKVEKIPFPMAIYYMVVWAFYGFKKYRS